MNNMVSTALGITSILLNIAFVVVITWFMITYFKLKKQVKSLVNELNNDSLEHYLNQIKKRGFDVTIKPGKKAGK